MPNTKQVLYGFNRIKPYRQGDLSTVCGIYAAINAARLLTPEKAPQRVLWTNTYQFAVAWLYTKRKLKPGLTGGLSFDVWKELQQAVYDELSEQFGRSYRMRPLIRRVGTKIDPAGCIRQAIDANCAVLCALSGSLDHYTVIAGYTSSRWLLHDSYGYRWVDMAVTAVGSPQGKRHWIPYPSLVTLYRAEEQS